MLRLAEIDNDWDRMQSLAGKTVMVVSSEEMDFHTLNQDGTTAVRRALFCVFELQPTRQEREEANRRAEMEISNRLPKKTVTSHVYSPIGTTAKNDMSISKPTHQRDTSQSATLNEFASKFGDLYDVHTTFSPSRIDQLSRLSNRELAKECGRVVTKYLKQQNAQAIQGKSPGVKMLVTGVTTFGRLVTRGGTLRTIRERLDCGAVSREEVIIQIINHSMLLTNK